MVNDTKATYGRLGRVVAVPKPNAVREAIANSIAENLKSYHVAAFCERLGLAAQGPDEDPFRSKRIYVLARLQDCRPDELAPLADAVLAEWDDPQLQELVNRTRGATGVGGELRNLIFASVGPKPEIVLRDALNNIIEITKGAETCLVYDRALPAEGLTWAALVDWWASEVLQETNHDVAGRLLYKRLAQSIASPAEGLLLRTYARRYGDDATVPALLPQVYLHYDPYLRPDPAQRPGAVVRQRMDFLLLLPDRRRIVLEVDGQHHYTTEDGRPSPARYATMAGEDRRLRLAGYEVYRFGGAELIDPARGEPILSDFFGKLLDSPPSGL